MKHESTTIIFTDKEGTWKVLYTPSEWSTPNAKVYLNDELYYDFERKRQSFSSVKNPTKTQASDLIKAAKKLKNEEAG